MRQREEEEESLVSMNKNYSQRKGDCDDDDMWGYDNVACKQQKQLEEAADDVGFEKGRNDGYEEDGGVVLGVDGGATSTVCVCIPFISSSINNNNNQSPPLVLGRSVAGCSNHNSIGESSARDTLEAVMNEALSRSGSNMSAVRAVCLGISGVNHKTDQERVLSWLRKIFPSHVKLYVQNDAVAALASGTTGKLHGCVLIAGTGCICYGIAEDGREARACGAGPILGDWGSGYGIAARALTAVMRAHDGRGPETMLTDKILKALHLSSPDELIGLDDSLTEVFRWTYADPSWARIAALVPEVVSCAEASDQVASKILLDAVQELALSVKAVAGKLSLCGEDGNGSFPVVMVGGVLESNKNWDIGKEVMKCIQKHFPRAFPVRPQVEPAVGAALLAQNFFIEETKENGYS